MSNWRDNARCAGAPEIFVPLISEAEIHEDATGRPAPDSERASADEKWEQQVDDAQRICRLCPVQWECLSYAVANRSRSLGVWGGVDFGRSKPTRAETSPGWKTTAVPGACDHVPHGREVTC